MASRFFVRIFFAASVLLAAVCSHAGVSYYVHPTEGNDANPGTDLQAPLQTLKRAGSLRLQPGDRVLLAAGQKFAGMLSYDGLAGTELNPILIATYQTASGASNPLASIDGKGCAAGVLLRNCAHVGIANLFITANGGGMTEPQTKNAAMRCGVLVQTSLAGEYSGLNLSNLLVKGVFYEEPGFVRSQAEAHSANGTEAYGWGIRFINNHAGATIKGITIQDCVIEDVSHTGLKFTATGFGIQNVNVQRVNIADTGGPGVQMSGVRQGRFSQLDVNRSGSTKDSRNWKRGSGLWTWGSSDVIIEKSRFQNANGPADSAGVHIDFNCRDVIVQHNFSANNAGGFCEILGNNHNCAYRYNVSVNDGHRVKGRNGAFQEGKTFWLSGYAGDHSPRQGPFNSYFYNNTIYVGKDITAKIAVAPTARGVLIANNIFCFEGRSRMVLGDQNLADAGMAAPIQDVVFKNNLFLRRDNWPADVPLQDQRPLLGDPGFAKAGGMSGGDYIPSNLSLVKDRGISIPVIPKDSVGLAGGLKVERDILGRPVVGSPDLGAIEMSEPGGR